jgi:SHAQKYF class myb-like DNA-binding protein
MEKFKFLEGIYKFGCNWKVIKKKLIGSRTTKQVRSHAQKFILKLRKFKDDSLGIDFTKDSDKNSHELIKKLKYIIENSSNKDILYILCKKLSQKKTKKNNKRNYKANTNIIKNESINDLKTNDVKDTTFNYNTSIYEDYSINKKETSFIENNNEIYDNDKKNIENYKKKDYELNSTLSCIIETNHYNILNKIVFEDNKLNSFDFLENEEKRIFWNINDKINILENENESYNEKISKTNSLNLLLSVYNSEFEEFKTINIINKEYCS